MVASGAAFAQGSAGLAGVGQVTVSATVDKATLTPEQRIELLEKGLAAANERIDGTERRLNNEEQERARADSQERDQRKEADEQIRKKLEDVSVGGLDLSLVGVWWLLIGIFLADFF